MPMITRQATRMANEQKPAAKKKSPPKNLTATAKAVRKAKVKKVIAKDKTLHNFERYKEVFDKSYISPKEEDRRRKYFMQDCDFITRHNQRFIEGREKQLVAPLSNSDLPAAPSKLKLKQGMRSSKRAPHEPSISNSTAMTDQPKPMDIIEKQTSSMSISSSREQRAAEVAEAMAEDGMMHNFERFKEVCEITYDSPQEEERRRKYFMKKCDWIVKYIDGLESIICGPNATSDWSPAENRHGGGFCPLGVIRKKPTSKKRKQKKASKKNESSKHDEVE